MLPDDVRSLVRQVVRLVRVLLDVEQQVFRITSPPHKSKPPTAAR